MFARLIARCRRGAVLVGGRLFGTIRVRLTLLAVLVVGLGLVAGGAIVVTLVRNSLTTNAELEALQRARDTGASIVANGAAEVPIAAGRGRSVVQVVDQSGQVVAASPELRGRAPIMSEWPTHSVTEKLAIPGLAAGFRPGLVEDTNYVVIGRSVTVDGQQLAVYAATSLESAAEGVEATVSALAIAIPLLLLVIAGASWLLVGRALRPVESMRRQVAEITAAELDRRVPEPAVRDELGKLAGTMNAMLARLEQARDRQHRFVSDAAHELRSPVASILTRVEVGLAHPAGADWPALARDVHREATRLERLAAELLTLSRMDGSTAPARDEVVDLDELVLLEVDAVRARGKVSVEIAPFSAARLRGRVEELRRVVRNLLDNAERHARERVTLGLSTSEGVVELVVSDDGAGIPQEDRERVFDRFYRSQPARDRDSGGAGLGLAIVRDIASAYGGRAWVAATTGGAEVHVRFPPPVAEGPGSASD